MPPTEPRIQDDPSMVSHRARVTQVRESLQLMRNVGASGAAFTAAVLVSLTQVGTNATALKIAVVAAAIALPLYLAYLSVCEMHLILDAPTFGHLDLKSTRRRLNAIALPAAVSLIACIGGITWYLYPPAVYIGAFAICVALVISMRVVLSFAAYARPPESTESVGEEE